MFHFKIITIRIYLKIFKIIIDVNGNILFLFVYNAINIKFYT